MQKSKWVEKNGHWYPRFPMKKRISICIKNSDRIPVQNGSWKPIIVWSLEELCTMQSSDEKLEIYVSTYGLWLGFVSKDYIIQVIVPDLPVFMNEWFDAYANNFMGAH